MDEKEDEIVQEDRKKNVLVVFLSTLSKRKEGGCHHYCGEYENDTYEGIQTNEAIAKYLIRTLAKKEEKLDQIVMICTHKVRSSLKSLLENEKNENMVKKLMDEKIFFDRKIKEYCSKCMQNDTSALLYFELAIIDFIKHDSQTHNITEYSIEKDLSINDLSMINHNSEASKSSFFKVIEIPDEPDEKSTYQYLSQLFHTIGKNTNMYLDLNGGFRDTVFILLALTRVMMQKGVELKGSYHINYNAESSIKEPMHIIDKQYLFNTYDLISGMDEFFEYGGVKKLDKFFENTPKSGGCQQKQMKKEQELTQKVYKEMQKISDSLKVCRATDTWEAIKNLKQGVKDIDNYLTETSINGSRYGVFFALIENVKQEYGTLLKEQSQDKDYLGLIEWCLNKNMIQQALTFYEDLVPVIFVEKRVLHWNQNEKVATLLEKKGVYRYKTNSKEYTFINQIENIYVEMIKEIAECDSTYTPPYSCEVENDVNIVKKINSLVNIVNDWSQDNYSKSYYDTHCCDLQLLEIGTRGNTYKKLLNIVTKDKWKTIAVGDFLKHSLRKQLQKQENRAVLYLKLIENGIIFSDLYHKDCDLLEVTINSYFAIKDIRNKTNHGENETYTLQDIRDTLLQGIKDIKHIQLLQNEED